MEVCLPLASGELVGVGREDLVRVVLEFYVGLDERVEAVGVVVIVVAQASAADSVLDGVALPLGVVAREDELGAELSVAVAVGVVVVNVRVGNAIGVDWVPAVPRCLFS